MRCYVAWHGRGAEVVDLRPREKWFDALLLGHVEGRPGVVVFNDLDRSVAEPGACKIRG
jgi:hypothetical protein